MKKSVLIVPALFMSMFTYAQGSHSVACTSDDPVLNRKGHAILPKAGDIALGFNAIPALDLAFNSLRYVSIMGNSAPVAANVAAPTNQYVQGSNNQIVGKYFLTDKTAIRAKVGYNTLSGSMVNRVQDAEAMYNATLGTAEDIAAATLLRVEDKLKYSKSNIMITAG